MPKSPYFNTGSKTRRLGRGGTWGSTPDSTAPSTGSVADRTRIDTGGGLAEAIQSFIALEPGIVAYNFYSTANAAAQHLTSGGSAISITVPFRGSIIAVTANASAAVSGTYSAYVNGAASGAQATLSTGTAAYSAYIKGDYEVQAGDRVTITASSVSGVAVVNTAIYIVQDPSTVI